MDTLSPRPAHRTKHLALLRYPFRNTVFDLAQSNNGLTNGTALWLGAQCLSLYLADENVAEHSKGLPFLGERFKVPGHVVRP